MAFIDVVRTWALMVAVLLSHGPLPRCGSLKSTLSTLIPVASSIGQQAAKTVKLW